MWIIYSAVNFNHILKTMYLSGTLYLIVINMQLNFCQFALFLPSFKVYIIIIIMII